jgi:tetrahydromethanopterin S-methyltransferase subunit A
MNLFHAAFPELAATSSISSELDVTSTAWPPVVGEYFVLCENHNCQVAVSTLASVSLAEELSKIKPKDLCIVGKTETENIGIEKIIKNTITNPSIHTLLIVGNDPKGHRSGATLLSLCEEGVDGSMRVIGSSGKHPILKNVTKEEVEAFRSQVKVADMIGCNDAGIISRRIKEIVSEKQLPCSKREFARIIQPVEVRSVEIIHTEKSKKVALDEAGYFVILPLRDRGIISVEHYSADNEILRVIEGKDATDIYKTIIKNHWVTELSHAAYIGKELTKAELSMKIGFKYIQDGA